MQDESKLERADFETADTVLLKENDFPTGNLLDALNETATLTLANAPSGNALYTAHYGVEIVPIVPGSGENVHEIQVALELDDGGGFIERMRTIYRIVRRPGDQATPVVWLHEQMRSRLTGVVNTDQIRLKVVAVTLPGGATFTVHGFNKATDADPRTSSPHRVNINPAGTANAAPVAGVTYHTGPALDFPDDGGATLADTLATKISHGASDGYMTDMDGPPSYPAASPFLVARIAWGSDDPTDLKLDRLTAFLHPKENGANPKTVHTWWCQLFAVSGVGQKRGTYAHVEIVPLSAPVSVLAGEGTAAADVTFDWLGTSGTQVPLKRPTPKAIAPALIPEEGSGQGAELGLADLNNAPATLVFIWATQSDGTAATNVGWAKDSATTLVTNGSRRLRTIEMRRTAAFEWEMEGPESFGLGATPRHMARLAIVCGAFANEKVQFSGAGNDFTFPVAPTGTVEFVGVAEVPPGSTCTFEVLKDGGTAGTDADWRAYTDGQVVGDIADVTLRQDYQLRARMTTNAGGDLTPHVVQIGVRELTRKPLHHVASVKSVRWAVDPVTCKAEVPECVIETIRDGERDYYDAITDLLATYDIGQITFRLFVGDPSRSRSEWLHLDDFLVDDTEAGAASIKTIGLSPLVLLRGVVPVYDDVTASRPPKRYANQTPAAVAADLLGTQLTIPGRYLGPGLPDVSTLVAKTLTDGDGKTELDALAWLSGAAWISSQGRITAVDLYGTQGIVATFPSQTCRFVAVTPGYRQRVPEFFVPWGWDEDGERFTDEVRGFHSTAITKLGQARIDPPRTLEVEIAKWIGTAEQAERLATRHLVSFGAGLLLWRFTSTLAYPELLCGDRVAIDTDLFVAKDPNAARSIRGQLWVVATVVGVHDALGTEFTVWIRSYADIIGVGVVGTGPGAPAVLSAIITSPPGQPANAKVELRSRVETATIYYVYLAEADAIPNRATASPWTAYPGILYLNRDPSLIKKLAVFANDRGIWSNVVVFEVAPDDTPTILNLTASQAGTTPNIQVTWTATPDVDVRRIRWYLRKGSWPTADGTQGAALSDTFFFYDKHVELNGGGFDFLGGVTAGGLTANVASVVYATSDVAYVIAVPVDVNGNVGPRKEASYTVVASPPSVTMGAPTLDTAGTSCGALRKYDFSWTDANITDAYELRLYARINGRRDLILTEGSPDTVNSANAVEVLCYPVAGIADVAITFEFELYNGTPTLVQSGVFGTDGFKGQVCAV